MVPQSRTEEAQSSLRPGRRREDRRCTETCAHQVIFVNTQKRVPARVKHTCESVASVLSLHPLLRGHLRQDRRQPGTASGSARASGAAAGLRPLLGVKHLDLSLCRQRAPVQNACDCVSPGMRLTDNVHIPPRLWTRKGLRLFT